MNHYVLAVYRNIFATIAFAPAFFLERPLSNNFYYVGLDFTSPTFGSALFNLVPVITSVIALIFRMEEIKFGKVRSQAKVLGTLVCVGGAMLMTFYTGPIVPKPWPSHDPLKKDNASNQDMVKGCLCLITITLAWASLFALQAWVFKKHTAQLSLVTLVLRSPGLLNDIHLPGQLDST